MSDEFYTAAALTPSATYQKNEPVCMWWRREK